jgi:hypothetical protein
MGSEDQIFNRAKTYLQCLFESRVGDMVKSALNKHAQTPFKLPNFRTQAWALAIALMFSLNFK